MRAWLPGLLLFPCLVGGSGCGTVLNTFIPCGGGTRPHVYGGVEIDVKLLESAWNPAETEEEKQAALRPVSRGAFVLIGTLFAAIDLPLSLVADTITLPWVIVVNGFHGWDSLQSPTTGTPRERPVDSEKVSGVE